MGYLTFPYLSLLKTPNIDQRVNRSNIRHEHRSRLVEAQTVGDLGAEDIGRDDMRRVRVLLEAADPVADFHVLDVGTDAGNDTSGFETELSDGELDNAECHQDILVMAVSTSVPR